MESLWIAREMYLVKSMNTSLENLLCQRKGWWRVFTPRSIVDLIVRFIEPNHGRIYDPACGSGGMFVQSARFVEKHNKRPNEELSVYGMESKEVNLRHGKMNLAVHGLSGDIRLGNTYYEDPHGSVGRFDFVMANPPFNVDQVDKERIKDDPRYRFGIPRADNANYLWIQDFYAVLNDKGRAGFVMANSASDAGQSEKEIREKLIKTGHVDVMVSISSNFFYTVTLPVSLWFFDKGKPDDRKDKVLFIDARNTFRQVDRAHRDFTVEQMDFLYTIVKAYRGEEFEAGDNELIQKAFPDSEYADVNGLCRVATLEEIKEQGWSLNPGRYVGVADEEDDGVDFHERLGELNSELENLNADAKGLQDQISNNIRELLG